jgi:kumamolisin
VAVVAMGGGFRRTDLAAAATAAGRTSPTVLVRRGRNRPGRDDTADEELALDLQVVAGVAPGARLAVYFAPGQIEELAAAIHAVAVDAVRPKVLVICWGSSEQVWSPPQMAATEAAIAAAHGAGCSVVAASGDDLACGGFRGEAHVLYPASSPGVLACGGSSFVFDASGQIDDEVVWNTGLTEHGSGGGISQAFPPPAYQQGVALPPSAVAGAGPGRGVPDVAAVADLNPGWRIVVDGAERVSGGTSAAAPFWAGVLALANARRATPIGAPHAALYGHAGLFRPVVRGDNRVLGIGYDATAGWNACAGLGVPRGAEVLQALVAA